MAIDSGPGEASWPVVIPPSPGDKGIRFGEKWDYNGPDHGASVISVGFGSGSSGPSGVKGGFALGPGFDAQVRPFAIRGWTADRMITGFTMLFSMKEFDDVKVINFSEGIYVGSGVVDTLSNGIDANAFKEVIRRLTVDSGKILVTTAGNDSRLIRGPSALKYPACWAPAKGTRKSILPTNTDRFANVVTVGGTARPSSPGLAEQAYSGTAYGSEVSVSAPGEQVPVWNPSDNVVEALTGTSIAAPFVCGTITQLFSINPKLSPLQAIEIVEATADAVNDGAMDTARPNWQGYGRVNVWKAFLTAANEGRLANNHQEDSSNPFSLPIHSGMPTDQTWYGFRVMTVQQGARIFLGDTQLKDDCLTIAQTMPARTGASSANDVVSYLAVAGNGSSTIPWGETALRTLNVEVRYLVNFTMRYDQMNGKTLKVLPPSGDTPIFEIALNPQQILTNHPETISVAYDDYVFTIIQK
jgi:hypothetical protein